MDVKPYTIKRYGIVGPFGNFWTHETFATADEALEHVKRFWAGSRASLVGYRAIPVTVTIAQSEVKA